MNSYNFNYILEKNLPDDFPMDVIDLIASFLCDCHQLKCNFCNEYFPDCFLKRCVSCKKKSCGLKECLDFPVNYVITHYGLHKEWKCCRKCQECLSD